MKVRVADIIDRSPIGTFQLRTVFICALIALLDGLDVQTMALVLPTLADDWGVSKASFATVLSASFIGLMLGAFAGGLLGDRFGRRIVLIAAFTVVGGASLLTATAENHTQLIIWRLLTGLGIGACMPNFTVLTAEYIPAKRQAVFITFLYAAIPLGGILGGLLAPVIIEIWNWQAVFIFSGAVPLLISIALIFGLPESPRYLAGDRSRSKKLGIILEKIDADYRYHSDHEFVVDQKVKGSPARALLVEGRLLRTLLLWTLLVCSLAGYYLMTSWLPTILVREGWSNFKAAQSLSYFFFGGAVACILAGWLIDRFGLYRVLAIGFVLDAAATIWLGLVPNTQVQLLVAITLAGMLLGGVQVGLIVLAARIYPTAMRATGVGWGLGIGRLGSVISPLLGGAAIAADWDRDVFFFVVAMPACLCVMLILFLQRHLARNSDPQEI